MFGKFGRQMGCYEWGALRCEWVADQGSFETRLAHLTMAGNVFDWRVRPPRGSVQCVIRGRVRGRREV